MELEAKARMKKEGQEARVEEMRQQREEIEYRKGQQIAMHEARVKNMDSQIAQLNEQL